MKNFFLGVILCVVGGLGALAQEAAPLPVNVTLTSGRVLRSIEVVRWDANAVVLKHSGGLRESIPFALIREPERTQLQGAAAAARSSGARAKQLATTPQLAKPDELVRYMGQVFIVTRGAGSYKLAGVRVHIFAGKDWARTQVTMTPIWLPNPLMSVVTDAEGKFEFSLPKGADFFVLAQGKRLVGRNEELYEWLVPSSEMPTLPNVLLSNATAREQWRSYRIEE